MRNTQDGGVKMKTFTLYAFIDENGMPFYIGITSRFIGRRRAHLREINGMNPLPKYHKARKVIATGKTFEQIMTPLEDMIPEDKIEQREIDKIKELRDGGTKLYNLTNGGDGAIATIPGISDKLRAVHLGKKRSEDTKKRMSLARKGIKFSAEHKKNLSVARKKRVTKIETRLKMSASSIGKINTKSFKLTSPDGIEHITTNGLSAFCREHGLTSANIIKVCNGQRDNHKGWRAVRLLNEEV
jgi:CRISPR/Cas system CSM-associated protein Csm2 small subunit